MYPSLGLRLVGLTYYTQLGTSGDLLIVALLSIWKTGYQHISSVIATRGLVVAFWTLFITVCFISLPLVYDYGRKAKSPTWTGPGRPLLFPCRITHALKNRSSEYSTLLVGVPVGWSGVAGGLISVDCQVPGFNPWHKIDAVDYLIPGPTRFRLRDKLDGFLISQGIEVSRYPYAYLVTTTGSTGSNRNQFSFWYLYSVNKQLTAIVAEMSNASDKRLLHVLFRDDQHIEDADRDSERDHQKGLYDPSFFLRNEICSIVASDPLFPNMEGMGSIKNTVSLISSEGHAKILARVTPIGEATDFMQLSLKQKLAFMFRWRWPRIITFPEIVKEVAIVLFEWGLAMWQHPKLLKETVTHDTTEVERGLELVFRNYLRYLVKQSSSSLRVRYVPAGVVNAVDEDILSTPAKANPDTAKHLEFKVLTPTFYLRFVCYAHDFEAMFCEFSENHTIWLSEPALLPKLVLKRPSPPLSTASYLDYAYFTAIQKLRRVPEKIERPLASRQIATTQALKDIREFRISSMDGYVLTHEEDKTRYLYRRLVLKLFIADRIAWGNIDILSLVGLFLRVLLAWIIILR